MIMRPTVIERSILNGPAAHELLEKMVDTDMSVVAAMIKNLLFTVKGTDKYIRNWNDDAFAGKESLLKLAEELFRHISEESAKESSDVTYSTTEVAKFAGVSVQTINTWLRENKIIGAPARQGREHVKIPEDAEVIFGNGKRIPVSALKANWDKENEEPVVDEVTYLEQSIKELEKKYGAAFEEIFGDKTIRELTEEDTDASVWLSYKARLESVKKSQYT